MLKTAKDYNWNKDTFLKWGTKILNRFEQKCNEAEINRFDGYKQNASEQMFVLAQMSKQTIAMEQLSAENMTFIAICFITEIKSILRINLLKNIMIGILEF